MSDQSAHGEKAAQPVEAVAHPVTETECSKEKKFIAEESKAGYPADDNLSEEFKRVDAGGLDPGYERKVFLMNKVMQDQVGMGRFQWQLFCLSGFGWFVDNIWLQGVAIILPQVGKEFSDAVNTPWMTFALYMGLITGAATWGILADVLGRRLSFNITLALGGIFGIAAGGASSFTALGGLLAALGFGVGGSLPVDGMLFLEFIPGTHQRLLTLLSVFWSIGQLFASLVAWGFIATYTCAGSNSAPADNGGLCDTSMNKGWRYTFYTLGAMTFAGFLVRFVIFQLPESPKFLLSQGRDAEAVAVVKDIARRNGRELPDDVFSLAILRAVGGEEAPATEEEIPEVKSGLSAIVNDFARVPQAIAKAVSGRKTAAKSVKPKMSHVKPLFANGKITYNTLCIVFIWGLIGLAYPLYNAFLPTYLAAHNGVTGSSDTNTTYSEYAWISACGVPGSIIATWLVELPRSGRRGALAISTLATGVFIFGLTGSKSNASYLALNAFASLVQNSMYGVLYHATPEMFPAPARGTGDGIASSFNRITGSMAPIIKIYAGAKNASAPLYTSGGLFVLAAILSVTLTVEGLGKSAL